MEELVLCSLVSIGLLTSVYMRFVPFANIMNDKQKRLTMIVAIVFCIINAVLLTIYCEKHLFSMAVIKLDIILFGIVTLCIAFLAMPHKRREHLFTYGLVTTLNYAIVSCSSFFAYILVGFDDYLGYFIGIGIYACIVICVFGYIKKMIIYTVRPFLTMECEDYWHTVWFIPMALFLAMFFIFPMNFHVTKWYELLAFFFLNMAAIVMCWNIAKDHRTLLNRQHMMEQLIRQKEHYDALQNRVMNLRKTKHDFKHHLSAIRKYIEADDKKGLADYVDALQIDITKNVEIPYTGNLAMDGVLYYYMGLAKVHQIDFSYVGTVEKMQLMDVDFSVLMGNALDNAIAGCLTIVENRFVKVEIASHGMMQKILISNSFDGYVEEDDGEILSRKRNHEVGIGLYSMKMICGKNDILMDIRYDDKMFGIMFLIPKSSND